MGVKVTCDVCAQAQDDAKPETFCRWITVVTSERQIVAGVRRTEQTEITTTRASSVICQKEPCAEEALRRMVK